MLDFLSASNCSSTPALTTNREVIDNFTSNQTAFKASGTHGDGGIILSVLDDDVSSTVIKHAVLRRRAKADNRFLGDDLR